MGSRCLEGAATLCIQDNTRDFGGAVPANIRQFEDRILRTHFKATLEAWDDSPNYHSYYNWSAICSNCSIDLVWQEYLYWPAPTRQGRRNQPVMEGNRSWIEAFPESAHGPRVPLPGGWVTHYVDAQSNALANAPVPLRLDPASFKDPQHPALVFSGGHVLHPGYIVRWLSIMAGFVISNTLGRGIGGFPRENEFYGVRIFHDLDLRIKESLGRPQK
jgi:hypothetical protein